MRQRWDAFVARIDGMSLRERTLIFAALAFGVVSVINSLLLDPLLLEQKKLSAQVQQQQEKMKESQAMFTSLVQAKQADENAPERERIRQLRQRLEEGDTYLKSKQERLVPPEKMAALLEQVLNKNSRLQLVSLETLPVSLFIEPVVGAVQAAVQDKKIYKHGVTITVRGSYANLLQYLTALEKMPAQMFWGMSKMTVVKYPDAELTLTLYTLSLDETWLQV